MLTLQNYNLITTSPEFSFQLLNLLPRDATLKTLGATLQAEHRENFISSK